MWTTGHTVDALKEGMLSMVRKLQRQFRHSQADQPRLQDQLLIGTKHTRQFQIDVLLNVALREEERVQMARAAAEHLQHVFGARSAMAQASFFHTPGPTMVHLHDRLQILQWTSQVVRDLPFDEFFLGDDFNSKDQLWLHSGGKQHLVRLAVSHAALEHLLTHKLQEKQLTHVWSQDPGCFRACTTQDGERKLVGLPAYLQIQLLDFTFLDWTTVNRVYAKPDLLKQAYTGHVDIPSTFRWALSTYMRHFREMARGGFHEVFIWVASFDYEQQKSKKFDTNQYTASAMR